jgi:hypothetical protein
MEGNFKRQTELKEVHKSMKVRREYQKQKPKAENDNDEQKKGEKKLFSVN